MLSQGRMTDGLNDHSIAVARVVLMVEHAKGGGGVRICRELCISFSVLKGCSIDHFVTNSELHQHKFFCFFPGKQICPIH